MRQVEDPARFTSRPRRPRRHVGTRTTSYVCIGLCASEQSGAKQEGIQRPIMGPSLFSVTGENPAKMVYCIL